MPLTVGTHVGPYEVLALLGAGGMGEVYRAKDPRLGREVAVKVLPGDVAADAGRRERFEQEARAASSLNHPNILTVHDIGEVNGSVYVAMELVEGKTLREIASGEPLPSKKLLEIGVQIADGLAKAHAIGIVHRDLKPENLMVSKDGFVKILDFGLAKLVEPESQHLSVVPTAVAPPTQPGTILGTVGYMSPEQASGQPLDFRSDQFALGSILYEMASGRKAFQRKTVAETLTAIIREEPEPLAQIAPTTPPPLRWIVERCLAKDREDRYVSTRDLSRDLASVRDHLSETLSSGQNAPMELSLPSRRGWILPAAAALVLGAVAALILRGAFEGRPDSKVHYQRLTWRRGTIQSARFAPDGQTVLYSAAWEGKPTAIYIKRPESPDAVPLELAGGGRLLAISLTGEMAIQLRPEYAHAGVTRGTLARVALTGGAPREIAENVNEVDWGPDGSLVVTRDLGENGRLEYPAGKVLYETAGGHVSFPRLSPRGDRIAFVDNPHRGNDRGAIAIVDLQGKKKLLAKDFESVQGLAWSPSGDEVWFTASRAGVLLQLWGVTVSGRLRAISSVPGAVRLQDVTRSGHVLLTQDDWRSAIRWLVPGESRERDFSWFGWSVLGDLSADGKTIVFTEMGEPVGPNNAACLMRSDSQPLRLGQGWGRRLSPDGRWVTSRLPRAGSPIVLLPTGPGEPKEIRQGWGVDLWTVSAWLPDSKRLVFYGLEGTSKLGRLFVTDAAGGKPRPISPEGVTNPFTISGDGRFVAAPGPDRKVQLYPVDGGDPRTVAGAVEGDEPVQWSSDGRSLYVEAELPAYSAPARVFRLNLDTGERLLWKELLPEDPAGIMQVGDVVRITPDGSAYAYRYRRVLADLYLVEGLR